MTMCLMISIAVEADSVHEHLCVVYVAHSHAGARRELHGRRGGELGEVRDMDEAI